jgi:hypothetical protein
MQSGLPNDIPAGIFQNSPASYRKPPPEPIFVAATRYLSADRDRRFNKVPT